MPKWGRNLIVIATALLLSCTVPSESLTNVDIPVIPTSTVETSIESIESSSLTAVEKKSRISAVRVQRPFEAGHGSGTYLKMHGRYVVVTAAHVVGSHTVMHIQERDNESRVVGRVIYIDHTEDLAVIHVPALKTRIAVPYHPKKNNKNLIGADVSYTGFPGHHNLITIRGHVASLEHEMIVCNMFGWFGASGSGVFDRRGRFLGVVSGIDVGRWDIPIPLDSIVWVAPAWNFDEEVLEIRVKSAPPLEIFNSFPGAAAPRRGGLRD